jgi:hypothetical protein
MVRNANTLWVVVGETKERKSEVRDTGFILPYTSLSKSDIWIILNISNSMAKTTVSTVYS